MIENKEIPSEYISLRQIWLRAIDDCRKAISQVANIESSSERKDYLSAGPRTVVHTVDSFYLSLTNYGEALILDDVDKWRDEHYIPENRKIWESKTKKKQDIEFSGMSDDDDEEDDNNQPLTIESKWWANAKLSMRFYKEIIAVLQKYNMLFPEPFRGYSNVTMEDAEL